MRVFVSGGAGFIGSHLVDRLVDEGMEVTVFDNFFRGKPGNIRQHLDGNLIELKRGDLRDYDDLVLAVARCEIVFHLGAQSNVMGAITNLDYSFETNVVGTYNLLKASREAGVRRFIFTSSREAYGEAQFLPVSEAHPQTSKNTYGASKVAGEKYCQVFQNMDAFEVVILRLANVYGTRDFDRVIPIFLDNVGSGQPIRIFGGKQVIDFISVEVVVEALVQSISNQEALHGPTNIGSGKGTTLFELSKRIQEHCGSDCKVIVEPARSAEVVKFTADVSRAREIFNLDLADDPLYLLPQMIETLQLPSVGT